MAEGIGKWENGNSREKQNKLEGRRGEGDRDWRHSGSGLIVRQIDRGSQEPQGAVGMERCADRQAARQGVGWPNTWRIDLLPINCQATHCSRSLFKVAPSGTDEGRRHTQVQVNIMLVTMYLFYTHTHTHPPTHAYTYAGYGTQIIVQVEELTTNITHTQREPQSDSAGTAR